MECGHVIVTIGYCTTRRHTRTAVITQFPIKFVIHSVCKIFILLNKKEKKNLTI
jgi:hypothetical protein